MQRESVKTFCASVLKDIAKKHRTFPADFEQAFTLLNHHLCPAKPARPLGPKRLIHLHDGEGFEVWKFQVMTQGLRPGQWPRLWVGVAPALDLLVPLELNMHGNNYSDNDLEKSAIERMAEYYRDLSAN
ncbi:hypothetical protein D3229_10060 [Leucobacter aridicollis]|uniref:Uncharacterized protein n=1 Tax=Leucobacter aridicollis TaxID=283878 RepID=A0A852RB37_9MICO|nr:hypothetical protein [Leucobacter aridicollis]NYD26110.1 hypothetical protein [Leucobacter aridicollis]